MYNAEQQNVNTRSLNVFFSSIYATEYLKTNYREDGHSCWFNWLLCLQPSNPSAGMILTNVVHSNEISNMLIEYAFIF